MIFSFNLEEVDGKGSEKCAAKKTASHCFAFQHWNIICTFGIHNFLRSGI